MTILRSGHPWTAVDDCRSVGPPTTPKDEVERPARGVLSRIGGAISTLPAFLMVIPFCGIATGGCRAEVQIVGVGGGEPGADTRSAVTSAGAETACEPAGGTVMAIDQLFLGDTDFSGTVGLRAWEGFGFDLDGLATLGDLDGLGVR